MSLLARIKKLLWEENKALENIPKIISLEELLIKIKKDASNHDNSKIIIEENLKKRVRLFNEEIKENIDILKAIDLNERKEDERIKNVVTNALASYLDSLTLFLKELDQIEDLQNNAYFDSFASTTKKFVLFSAKHFDKATILIGEPLRQTNDKIKNFFLECDLLFSNHLELNISKEKLSHIKTLIDENDKLFLSKIGLEENKIRVFNQDEVLTKQRDEIKETIILLNKSPEFIKDQKEREALSNKKKDFESQLQQAKDKLNLKLLTRIFHSDKKKMLMIQEYHNNFKEALENDEDLGILSLFIDSNQKVDELSELLKELKFKIKDVDNFYKSDFTEKAESLNKKLEAVDNSLKEGLTRIKEIDKKIERVKSKIEDNKNLIANKVHQDSGYFLSD